MLNKEMLLVTKENKNPLEDAHIVVTCAKKGNLVGFNTGGLGAINRVPYWSLSNNKQMILLGFTSSSSNSNPVLTFVHTGANNLPMSWSLPMTISINNNDLIIQSTTELRILKSFTIEGVVKSVSLDNFLGIEVGICFTPAPTGYK